MILTRSARIRTMNDDLIANADRLINDDDRRKTGDFWTPLIWAKRADELLKDVIGKDYKDNALVWDCACGAKNLTRQFEYKHLYSSTLYQSELDLGRNYNIGSPAFAYDFLNDDVDKTIANTPNFNDWKLPNSLLKELTSNNKPIVFFTNPPYGTTGLLKRNSLSKKDLGKTKINQYMKRKDYGRATQQLYAQFFARVIKLVDNFNLRDAYLAFFSNSRYFNGGEYWEKFNKHLFTTFELKKAILLPASEFNDTSKNWSITFAVYKLNKRADFDFKNMAITLPIEVSKVTQSTASIVQTDTKTITPVYPENALSDWMKAPIRNRKYDTYPNGSYPHLSSALNASKGKRPAGKLNKGAIGYLMNSANNVVEGTLNGGVWIINSTAYHKSGMNIMPENFERTIVNFSARRSITPNWINSQDNFRSPNTSSLIYDEYVTDSLVFSLFDVASNQASYRNPAWSNTGIKGRFINQWFWLSRDYVLNVTKNYQQLVPIYQDLLNDDNRLIAKKLATAKLSREAQKVLKFANLVWKDTLFKRPLLWDKYPKLYLQAWDAGWYQIKKVNRIYPSNYYSEFQKAFSILKSKLAKNVYLLGMLDK